MSSIGIFAWLSVAVGCALSIVIGRGNRKYNPSKMGIAISSIVFSLVLGGLMSFAAGMAHAICHEALHICGPTYDTTIFSLLIPVVAAPIFLIIMVAAQVHED
jgi:hypothetical protein